MQIRHRLTGEVLAEVPGETAAGGKLRGVVLLYGDLRGIGFQHCDLTGADLCEADLRGANFDGAQMNGADLSGSDLRNASFRGAALADAKLLGTNLAGTDFTGADLTHSAFRLAYTAALTRFTDAKLGRADLSRASLPGADFSGADLSELTGIELVLRGASLRGVTLAAAHLLDADLRDADLEHADLTLATLHRVKLAGASLLRTLVGSTVFAVCADLADARHLDQVSHAAMSSIDLATWQNTNARLPAPFLEGVGMGDEQPSVEAD